MKYTGPEILRLSGLGVGRLNGFGAASMNSAEKGERAPSLLFYVRARRTYHQGGWIAFNTRAANACRFVRGVKGVSGMLTS